MEWNRIRDQRKNNPSLKPCNYLFHRQHADAADVSKRPTRFNCVFKVRSHNLVQMIPAADRSENMEYIYMH